MSPFQFQHHPERHELEVCIDDPQFTAATVPEFKTALDAAWRPDLIQIVLDLSAVEFIDSSGVGALLSVQKRLPIKGVTVTLRGAQPAVLGVLELLRLQRVFKLE